MVAPSFILLHTTFNRYSYRFVQAIAIVVNTISFLLMIYNCFYEYSFLDLLQRSYTKLNNSIKFTQNLPLKMGLQVRLQEDIVIESLLREFPLVSPLGKTLSILTVFIILLTMVYLFFRCAVVAQGSPRSSARNWYEVQKRSSPFLLLVLIQVFLLIAFTAKSILLFYVAFEAIMLPMGYLIGLMGNDRFKTRAFYYFFLYTAAGSLLLLLSISFLVYYSNKITIGWTDINIVAWSMPAPVCQFCWICFAIGFAVKVPLVPVHLWLPEAHVQAPTEGSVILAALLLKLGVYGLYTFTLMLLPFDGNNYGSYVVAAAIFGYLSAAATACAQFNIKRVIAYSSISHMSLCVAGLFSNDSTGVTGALIMLFAHAFVASGLFFAVGMLGDRYHTKDIRYLGGLMQRIPRFSYYFLSLLILNISFPVSLVFTAEINIFVALLSYFDNYALFLLCAFGGYTLSVWYTFRMVGFIIFGNLNINCLGNTPDLTRWEQIILFVTISAAVLLFIWPNSLVNIIVR